jgi:hypothetical protein
MTITGRPPGEERSTPKKEKTSSKPDFGNNKNFEAHSTHLPRHKEVAQLLALLRERYPVIQNYLSLAKGSRCRRAKGGDRP